MPFDLPRDIMNIIVSKMDIETRMKLGIITRFKETREFSEFKRHLNETLSKVQISQHIQTRVVPAEAAGESYIVNDYYVSLSIVHKRKPLFHGEPIYTIYREIIDNTLYQSYIIHIPSINFDNMYDIFMYNGPIWTRLS